MVVVTKIRNFLKRHILWAGFAAAAVPLLIIFALQYRSLAALEKSLPIARRDYMRNYLVDVASETERFYRASAEHTLNVPPSAFNHWNRDMPNLSEATKYFDNNGFKGARRIFLAFTGQYPGGESYVAVVFYDPSGDPKLHREMGSRDWRAAHAACASWLVHNLTKTIPESPGLTVDERDPEARIIVKPIIDETTHMVAGVAGMILDSTYFKAEFLPGAIKESLPGAFAGDYQDAVIALRDEGSNLIFTNQKIENPQDEVSARLPFVFTDWRLGMGMLHMTEEEWAKQLFGFNLSLSILMTVLVIGGIAMALKTASREMKVSQMKADFVSNVSHELRTPLASIRVFGEFLRLGRVKEPEKVREYGEYIETESRRLTQLINNILDFSRIESGHKTYQFERANVSEVVTDTLRAFEVRLNQSGFEIEYDCPARPLSPARIDPDAIAQAFINLLDNAFKYSGTANRIEVKLGEKDGFITVSVTDHGVGVPREEREKIFEKFYRVSTGLVHDVKGSGLGLAIVKHIVDAHQGRLTLVSKQGAGSTFTIHLPVADDTTATPQGSQPAGGHGGSFPLNTVTSDR